MFILLSIVLCLFLMLLFPCSTERRITRATTYAINAPKYPLVRYDSNLTGNYNREKKSENESERQVVEEAVSYEEDNTSNSGESQSEEGKDETEQEQISDEGSNDRNDSDAGEETYDTEEEPVNENSISDDSLNPNKVDNSDEIDEMALESLRKELRELTERLEQSEQQLNRALYSQNDIRAKKLQVAVRPMNGFVRTEFFNVSTHVPLFEEVLFLSEYHMRESRFSKETTAIGDADVFMPREHWNRFAYVNVHKKKSNQYVCWGVALTLAFNFDFLEHSCDFYENDGYAYGFSTVVGRVENRHVAFVSVLLEVNAERENLIVCCRALNDRLKAFDGVQVVMGGIFGMSPTNFDQLIYSAECDVLWNASMHSYNQATYWDSNRNSFAPYVFVRTNNAQITQQPTVVTSSNSLPHTFLQGCEVNIRTMHLLNKNMGEPMKVVEE